MVVATHNKPTATEPQHDQIRTALMVAIGEGWIQDWGTVGDELTPEDEYAALSLLAPHRAKLRKMGVLFPTKGQYQDRLVVEPGLKLWVVRNLTKGTVYTVTESGLRLDCTCDTFGTGWCKHREAVEAWRDEHGSFDVPKSKHQESQTLPWVDDSDPVMAMLEVMGELPSSNPPVYDFTFPPHITPSEEQSAALQSLGRWYDAQDPIFRLTGSAGTGKSTAIQAFIRYLRGLTLPPKIAVSAPLNKAVKVQQKILKGWGLGDIPTFTCAQLFGVRRKTTDTGEEVFVVDPNAYTHYKDYQIIIVDEGSTINAQLWEMLVDATKDSLFSPRFIVLGDPAQLPPVNEGESLAMRWPCPNAHLSTVQRYDGAIARMADDVRQNLDRPTLPPFTMDVDPDTKKGIYAVDKATWEAMVRKVFTSPAYHADPDYAKALAYTNKRVHALNVMVRNALGYRAPWVVGERIIALAPYLPTNGDMGLTTSDEATIEGICEGSVAGTPCWFLALDNGGTIPVPRYPAEFEARLAELRKAKQFGKYWALKELFAAITYAYALTVHRAQGSTYRYAFVDVGDFKLCKGQHRTESGERVLERNQLLYVALTRPSERLIVSI
jgi:hypothetical protein